MSISEQGGITDGMSAVLTPAPVESPAMTTVHVNVTVTMPTSWWLARNYSPEYFEDLYAGDGENEKRTATASVDCFRRFVVDTEPLGAGWVVYDQYDGCGAVVATFDKERHAHHYANALERNPSLVDDA